MSEGREVLGYTLIRREPARASRYWAGDHCEWTVEPQCACQSPSVPELLTRATIEQAWQWGRSVPGATWRIGRVVRIPGKQTVEQIQDPTEADAWGVRTRHLLHGTSDLLWRRPCGGHISEPFPMTWDEAVKLRDEFPNARYLVPLRVTESEPRTVVEEVECE